MYNDFCRLNAVREICSRCPLSMNEDLLGDLVQYKHHRDKSKSRTYTAFHSCLLCYQSVCRR